MADLYLALPGGGLKGVAYAGALAALDSMLLSDPRIRLRGSIGASIGALFALAVLIDSGRGILHKLGLELNAAELVPTLDPRRLVSKLALNGDLRAKVGHIVTNRLRLRAGTTFVEFTRRYDSDLVIVCSDLVSLRPVLCSSRLTPDMLIEEAIVASMSIPLLYDPVCHEDYLLVDGAMHPLGPLIPFPRSRTICFGFRQHDISCRHLSPKPLLHGGIGQYLLRVMQMLLWSREPEPCQCVMYLNIYAGPLNALSFQCVRKDILIAIFQGMLTCANALYGNVDAIGVLLDPPGTK